MLCYCIQIEFTSLVRIKTLCLLYLLSVVEAGCCFLVSFSRVSSVLCFGCHVVGSCSFGKPLLRDVTGKALLCSRCSVVLRHWHGPRLHKWLVFKVRVQRTGARWRAQLRGVSEMFKPCSRESERQKRRERARRSRVVLNRPTWPCPRAACRIRLSVWGGAPPPCPGFLGVEFTWSDIPVIPWKIQTYRFYMPV